MSEPRSFLFLQGPMGAFFKKLAAQLRLQGHRTLRINFNGGDRLHFSSRHAKDFIGTLADWPEAVAQIAAQHGITDLVIYGDCRPLHRIAINTLKPLGITVHVFEEGYFRPDWITLERGGVNGYSSLPHAPEFYLNAATSTPTDTPSSFGPTFTRLVRHTLSYYTASALTSWRYKHYRSHRSRTYQKEGLAWVLRLTENYIKKPFRTRSKQRLLSDTRPYFLVLLQLLGDSQIAEHSDYNDMYEFLNDILSDFAEHAPTQSRLVIKNHPLDNGLMRYRHFLAQKAHSLGLGDRIIFIDGGHLPTLLAQARGVLTINSTGGLSAIHQGKPTKIFGKAVYDIAGLTDAQPLATFWHSPQAPSASLYVAFRHYVITHTQINGSFYTRAGIRQTIVACMPKLYRANPTLTLIAADPREVA